MVLKFCWVVYEILNIYYIAGETLKQKFCKKGEDTGSFDSGDSNSSLTGDENAEHSSVESDGSWDSHKPEV